MTRIRVGTRKSKLAMTQTRYVIEKLQAFHPEIDFEIITYQTKGDRLIHASLKDIGGKGVFVKDIERALIEGEIDLAVHSLKDLPAKLPSQCMIGAIPVREDVRDVMIFKDSRMNLYNLPAGSIVGTSSQRRQVQLSKLRPDLIFRPLRGNIDTRIQKCFKGDYDAIILAKAGLNRLNINLNQNFQTLTVEECLPAISQGALALECLSDNHDLIMILNDINDSYTSKCISLERLVLAQMNADCTFPIAAYAHQEDNHFILTAMLANEKNECIYASARGPFSNNLAMMVVKELKNMGGFAGRW